MIASKLKRGDIIRVIAPSLSMSIIGTDTRNYAKKVLEEELKLIVTFGKNVEESDDVNSSSIDSRIEDLHDAFSDTEVKGIFTIIGGFNSNQLLNSIDWNLLKQNPKIFCGFSDITVLTNAIYAKTDLVTYSGPHYSSFGQKHLDPYTINYLKECLFEKGQFEINSSEKWSDDLWFLNQEDRKSIDNEGFVSINAGESSGTIVGGNLCSLNLLQGTEFMPSLQDKILFIEDDSDTNYNLFDRDLQSLIHLPQFPYVKGIVIGRFQKGSEVSSDDLIRMIKSKKELNYIPVISNVDFGHTDPKITFPIGGKVKMISSKEQCSILITNH